MVLYFVPNKSKKVEMVIVISRVSLEFSCPDNVTSSALGDCKILKLRNCTFLN